MHSNPLTGLGLWLLVLMACGVGACRSTSRDVTYNPFVENRGRPTLGKQVEGIPDGLMERIEQFDSRMENRLY